MELIGYHDVLCYLTIIYTGTLHVSGTYARLQWHLWRTGHASFVTLIF